MLISTHLRKKLQVFEVTANVNLLEKLILVEIGRCDFYLWLLATNFCATNKHLVSCFLNFTQKKWKIWPKTHFLVFALFVGNLSNKHHYNLLQILRIHCFWYFCPKWLFPKLFLFKFEFCIKVVALIKITIVFEMCHNIPQKQLKTTVKLHEKG